MLLLVAVVAWICVWCPMTNHQVCNCNTKSAGFLATSKIERKSELLVVVVVVVVVILAIVVVVVVVVVVVAVEVIALVVLVTVAVTVVVPVVVVVVVVAPVGRGRKVVRTWAGHGADVFFATVHPALPSYSGPMHPTPISHSECYRNEKISRKCSLSNTLGSVVPFAI